MEAEITEMLDAKRNYQKPAENNITFEKSNKL